MSSYSYELNYCDVEVEATLKKGTRDTPPSFACAGGYPGDPPEVNIKHIWLGTGKTRIDILPALSSEQVSSIEDDLLEDHSEEEEDDGDTDGY